MVIQPPEVVAEILLVAVEVEGSRPAVEVVEGSFAKCAGQDDGDPFGFC